MQPTRPIFYLIALLLPLLILLLAELGLRLAGYGSSYPLFVTSTINADYLEPNPRLMQRYFAPNQAPALSMDTQLILQTKPANSFRIVVQGGSTAAGFPYGRWGGLAGMLAFSLFANKIRLDQVDADGIAIGVDDGAAAGAARVVGRDLHEDRAIALWFVHLEVARDDALRDATKGVGRVAIATDRRAGGCVVAQRKEGQVLGVDAEQGDIVGLVGGEYFDDGEESSVEGEHAHRFAGRACGHMVIGGDDAVIGDGEAARQSIMPFGAFIAFVGGADEYGRLGAAPIDVRTFERRTRARLSGKTNGIGTRAFALFEPVLAPERAGTFFRQG